jgi:Skp family chaperone for outer membrane proteins
MIKRILISLLLFLVLIFLIIGGINFLDYVGLISKEEQIYPYLSKLPFIGKFFLPKRIISVDLLKEEELRKLREEIESRWQALEEKEKILANKEEELKEKEAKLLALEDELRNKEKVLEERIAVYEDKERRWQRLAIYYQKMQPKRAAEILAGLDDQTIINILMRMREEVVAITLMEMDPKRAAELTRKMVR